MARAGAAAAAAFVILYGVELWPSREAVAYLPNRVLSGYLGGWRVVLNAAVVIAFLGLLPYRRPTKALWRSRGVYAAFAVALMTEMLGWPLAAYLISPLVQVSGEPYAYGAPWRHAVGTAMSLAGLGLVFWGWRQIHGARGLVTEGLYRWARHPQYTGILLFALGWAVHFPTGLTWAMLAALAWAYALLALEEERAARDEFGAAYEAYALKTKRFVPALI